MNRANPGMGAIVPCIRRARENPGIAWPPGTMRASQRLQPSLPVSSPSGTLAHHALSPSHFRLAVAAVFILVMLSALDQMTVSVALPTIAASLSGVEWMAWVISGYLVASTVVTPIYGKFGDMYGRRHMLTIGVLIFLVGSIGCALADSLPMLVAARLVQGAGAGGVQALGQGVVADIVPMRSRGRYQGYVSIVWATASLVGPILGGLLTQYLSWRLIFWLNVPLAIAAILLARRGLATLPEGQGRNSVDWAGALLLMVSLVLLLVPVTRLGQGVPPTDTGNLAWFTGALALLVLFWRQQRRAAEPILPMALLAHPVVIRGCALMFLCFSLFVALCLLVPLRLQLAAGWSAARSGAFLMWLTLAAPVAVFLGGRWMHRTGRVRPLQRLGPLLATGGLLWLAWAGAHSAWLLVPGLVVVGFGLGLQMPTVMLMVQNAVPRQLVGTATALAVLFRSLGGAIGIAVLSTVVFALLQPAGATGGIAELARRGLGSGAPVSDGPFRVALLVAAGLSLVSVVLARRVPDTRLHLEAPAASGEA